MKRIISIGTLGVAGAVATGLLAFQGPSAFADDAAYKRDDDAAKVVMTVDDDDDDDTNDDGMTQDTGNSVSANDGTNSRVTGVSRDRDLSRGDLTKDFTNDGPGNNNRDLSADHTNDNSRNDTRR
ncbi:MAG: hypothetical protein LH468_13415 [Nocardioides sp.]|nr:hypothetical protein [Nocardioides sp.]